MQTMASSFINYHEMGNGSPQDRRIFIYETVSMTCMGCKFNGQSTRVSMEKLTNTNGCSYTA